MKQLQNTAIMGYRVNGMTRMNIHPDYMDKKVLTFVADLIIEESYDSYSDLDETDKMALASLLIEAGGRDDEFSFLTNSSDSEQLINALRKALDGTSTDNQTLIDIIKDNVVEYYDNTMEKLFIYVMRDYECSKREWLDHLAKQGDPDEAYDRYRETL